MKNQKKINLNGFTYKNIQMKKKKKTGEMVKPDKKYQLRYQNF